MFAARVGTGDSYPMLLGCVADDATGATDLADALTTAGLSTELLLGVPTGPLAVGADAVVVALKTRMGSAKLAVESTLAAWRWLTQAGAPRCLFKICSTFDSTDDGNIGPVADALAHELAAEAQLVCPAFPANARTVYLGHLFVGSSLLSDSPMADHPLTPMRDANLVNVLGRQSGHEVGLVPLTVVRRGLEAVLFEVARSRARHLIVDAVHDDDLAILGAAIVAGGHRLATGGSALGGAIAAVLAGANAAPAPSAISRSGPAVILAGSCSAATRGQVEAWDGLSIRVDPRSLEGDLAGIIAAVVAAVRRGEAVLVASGAEPSAVAAAQAVLGVAAAGELVEQAFGAVAKAAVSAGAKRLVIAGGETAGAVTSALGISRLAIGPTISTGVAWTRCGEHGGLELALKSGNFGRPNFFAEALGA